MNGRQCSGIAWVTQCRDRELRGGNPNATKQEAEADEDSASERPASGAAISTDKVLMSPDLADASFALSRGRCAEARSVPPLGA
jgi:hypothetical protein